MNNMSDAEIERALVDIDQMTRFEMAQLWRNAPAGHPYFDRTLPLAEHFERRFKSLGEFSPSISKAIEEKR